MRRNKGFCGISNTGIFVVVILALFCMVVLPVSAQAAILRVDGVDGNDANDGSDWTTNAFKTIGAAISIASDADDIWVREGTYIASDLLGYLSKTVNLYGGFPASVDEPTWDDRNWIEYETILDGGGSSRVFLINSGNPIIDGFTITNGYTSSTGGGAIFTGGGTGTTPTFRNCNIKNNTCGYVSVSDGWGGGGAIAVYISSPTFINCLITNNSAASAYGGGVWLQSGSADFINCTITQNIALLGGGIYLRGDTSGVHHAFYNCIIWGNTGTDNSNFRDAKVQYNTDAPDGSNNCSSYYFGDNGVYGDCLFADPNNGDFHITPGSPCIDAGTGSISLPSTDIEGEPRVMDGDENGTATVDIGADELDPNQQFFADMYVDGDNGDNNNDGSDWQNAKRTIQAAIDAADANEEIWVKMGTYTITSEISLDKVVRIYAGFLGSEVQRNARDWKSNTTTITVDPNESARCLHITAAATIDGFKITGANAYGKHGAGILASGEGATIINCNITGNKSIHDDPNNRGGSGGGIYCSRTTYIENCEITDNEAATVGGGIYTISSSNTTIKNCTITGNTAVTTFYGGGGGIYNDAGFAPKIIGCTITNNTSGKHGGGIYNNVMNDAEITACKIILNTAENYGGGIYNGELSSTSSNYASPVITNCIIANNQAAKGGGIFCEEKSSPDIVNCTIAGNRAETEGAGVFVTYRYCYTEIMNSILYGNTLNAGGHSDVSFTYYDGITGSSVNNLRLLHNNFSVLYSWMNDDASYKIGNIGVVADFVDYEGPDNDPRIGGDSDYHLTSGSGLIDQGIASYAAFNLTAPSDDLDGMARPQGAGYDLGAYEILIQDSDGDGVNNNIDNCPSIQNPNQEDQDEDDIGDACDACMLDPNNDIDDDGICGNEDSCPNDPNNDTDGDGICGDVDTCPNDPNNDADGDGICGDVDGCPDDPNKADPGICGCGTPDTDTDGDGTQDCVDNCPNDPNKIDPGICGCGTLDTDSDGDGTLDCNDECPNDSNKTDPGICGCGIADTDSDGDGSLNCNDVCPNDPNNDTDGDGICGDKDICPNDPSNDFDGDGICEGADEDDDNDGMPDAWEADYAGLDPLEDDALGDLDSDEFTNIQEYLTDSDPNDNQSVPLAPIADWFVDGNVASSGNGASWTFPFKTIQEAIDAADADDEIWVKAGTYNIEEHLNVNKTVAIYGGFAGGETERDQRNWETNVTTVDGQSQGDICFLVRSNATIDGFTIRNGGDIEGGGGMEISQESGSSNIYSPAIRNCTFLSNEAGMGGAIYNRMSAPAFINCTFSGNTGNIYGGAIGNVDSDTIITGCTFSCNTVTGSEGGAVYNGGSSSLTISSCTFLGNTSDDSGGAIYNDANIRITNSKFFGNDAGDSGGSICSSGPMSVISSIFAGNSADEQGGAIFAGNSADNQGGTIGFVGSPVSASITNCTFTGNSADKGGGISAGHNSCVISNCILWDNTATTEGPEIYNNSGSDLSVTYCDVQGGYGDPNDMNIDEDPLFVDSNSPDGDPNTWMEIDYHLQAGSPCIDSGNNNEIPPDIDDADNDGNTAEPFPFDLSGGLRILNGTVDMGAYEAFITSTGESLGIGVSNGIMTSCLPVDPATLPDDGKPDADSLIYGLMDIVVETEIGDTTTVTISLPEPAPIGYTWFKYGYRFDEISMQYDPNRSWYDYSDHVVFSPDRTQVTITLVDGGIGDDDRMVDGKTEDPSGLGLQLAPQMPGGWGDKDDCFISTVTHGSTSKSGFGLILFLVSFTFIIAFRRKSE